MKIVRLSIKNFLGIIEAEIKPGALAVFSGKNGQGKSSILKALQAVFKGMTPQEIHKGTERAEIIAELEDLTITRVQTLKTGAVAVRTKDNFTRNAPQKFLDGLLGAFAFNPMAFLLADEKQQQDLLLKAMEATVTRKQVQEAAQTEDAIPVKDSGPALEQYAAAHKWFYDARTNLNRTAKQKQGALAETRKKLPDGFKPDEQVDEKVDVVERRREALGKKIAGLEAEQRAAERAEKTRERLGVEQEELAIAFGGKMQAATAIKFSLADEEAAIALVASLEEQLATARRAKDHIIAERQRRITIESESAEINERMKRNLKTLEELPGAFDDALLTEVRSDLERLAADQAALELVRNKMRTYEETRLMKDEIDVLAEDAHRLDQLVELFGKALPAKALAEAKLPVEGLAIGNGQVTVNGIPLRDLSTSEQINTTLSIARALVPGGGLKTICIDGWERLDEEKQAEFIRLADGDGFQYFVTRVGAPREGELEVAGGKMVGA